MVPSTSIDTLLQIMRELRNPISGCPWDQVQSFASIAPYTVEEAYEVVDAIERDSMADLRDELGDLLLQVVFHAQMASERGAFSFSDVVMAITAKMIRRHPHVFGAAGATDPKSAKRSWNEIKAQERALRKAEDVEALQGGAVVREDRLDSLLADVPKGLPSLSGALKLQQRAAEVGFDWSEAAPILDKVEEEVGEFRQALRDGRPAEVVEEYGDLLFALVNLGRHLAIDPELALRQANNKFRKRFGFVERSLAQRGSTPHQALLQEMEALWQQAKLEERQVG